MWMSRTPSKRTLTQSTDEEALDDVGQGMLLKASDELDKDQAKTTVLNGSDEGTYEKHGLLSNHKKQKTGLAGKFNVVGDLPATAEGIGVVVSPEGGSVSQDVAHSISFDLARGIGKRSDDDVAFERPSVVVSAFKKIQDMGIYEKKQSNQGLHFIQKPHEAME